MGVLLLKDEKKFWESCKNLGDYYTEDEMKVDIKEKYDDYLNGEIIATLNEDQDISFLAGWLVRKNDGFPYLFAIFQGMDYTYPVTAKVTLDKKFQK